MITQHFCLSVSFGHVWIFWEQHQFFFWRLHCRFIFFLLQFVAVFKKCIYFIFCLFFILFNLFCKCHTTVSARAKIFEPNACVCIKKQCINAVGLLAISSVLQVFMPNQIKRQPEFIYSDLQSLIVHMRNTIKRYRLQLIILHLIVDLDYVK